MNKCAVERDFNTLSLGEEASFYRAIEESDLLKFAELSGDFNPLHTDREYAKSTQFRGLIAHGMFLGSLVSRLIGMKLPGKYALLMKETLEFKHPVEVGDVLRVGGVVSQKSNSTRIAVISIEISNNKNIVVASGSVYVRLLK